MNRLRLFGFPTVEGVTDAVALRLERHSKPLAVLVYLAAHGGACRTHREALFPVFWPDSDEAHARNALRQTIFFLRGVLEPGTIRGADAGVVALDPERLRCDLWDFRAAVRTESWIEASTHPVGEFLQDFTVRDADAFMDWVDGAKHELRKEGAYVWSQVARDAVGQGDWTQASRAWTSALHLMPYDELYLRELVSCLASAGDRAAAVRAYSRFSKRLRDHLELEPTPSTVRHVERAIDALVEGP